MNYDISTLESARGQATGAGSWPLIPDQGDGTYRNPVIHADYSDPDVIRVGEDFYLVASSFNCTPGLPILHSRDLVNWRLINHAVNNLPHSRYAQVQAGCGVWAPSIRFHAGKFWIFFPMPDEGIYVTTATHPGEKWSEPHLVQPGKGLIDPCPLWDDDGQAYLVHAYAQSRSGLKHILHVRPMSPDGLRFLGEGAIVFNNPEKHPTLEGPKFLKRDGWYYILAPAGGVETGWQVVLRSRSIYGPYEDNIVLAQGATTINGPHQGALVDTANGDSWFVHFQDAGVYGRITHLQPVRWQEGWPIMGTNQNGDGCGEPVLTHAKPFGQTTQPPIIPQTSDEFEASQLGLQWQWHANHDAEWYSLAERKGFLRLYPQTQSKVNLTQLPNLLLQKFPARSFMVETSLEMVSSQAGEEAGLIVLGEKYMALALQSDETKNRIVLRTGNEIKPLAEATGKFIKFRVEIKDGGQCCFSYAERDEFIAVSETFQAGKGIWIGAKVGIYSLKQSAALSAGYADFRYFRFSEGSGQSSLRLSKPS